MLHVANVLFISNGLLDICYKCIKNCERGVVIRNTNEIEAVVFSFHDSNARSPFTSIHQYDRTTIVAE